MACRIEVTLKDSATVTDQVISITPYDDGFAFGYTGEHRDGGTQRYSSGVSSGVLTLGSYIRLLENRAKLLREFLEKGPA